MLGPLIGPYVVAFPLLIPVVPVLDPAPPTAPVLALTPPVAAAPPAPATCASATDEVTARTEAKAIVVSFMWFFPATLTSKATAPARAG
jgi:hypothetical protein